MPTDLLLNLMWPPPGGGVKAFQADLIADRCCGRKIHKTKFSLDQDTRYTPGTDPANQGKGS